MANPAQTRDLPERTFVFACGVVVFCRRFFRWSEPERTLAGQLARAGVSVGANTEEAAGAQTRPDLVTKRSISLKEARESHFLLRVIYSAGLDQSDEIQELIQQANELVSILTTSVKRLKAGS